MAEAKSRMTNENRAIRPFRGPNVNRLPIDFPDWAVFEAKDPGGLPRTKLTKRSGQNCKWSDYLRQLAVARGLSFEMVQEPSRRIIYYMRALET